MNEIEKAASTFVEAVKNSREYQNYQRAKNELQRYPEEARRMNRFREKNFRLQNHCCDVDLFSEIEKLEDEFRELNQGIVREYLDAESSICSMLRKVNWMLAQNLDMEMFLMEDQQG